MFSSEDCVEMFPSKNPVEARCVVAPNPLSICNPLSDRVVVKLDHVAERTSPGGIVLTSSDTVGQPVTGTIVAVGPGKKGNQVELSVKTESSNCSTGKCGSKKTISTNAVRVPMDTCVGDRVLVLPYAGARINDVAVPDCKAYVILHEEDILATLPD